MCQWALLTMQVKHSPDVDLVKKLGSVASQWSSETILILFRSQTGFIKHVSPQSCTACHSFFIGKIVMLHRLKGPGWAHITEIDGEKKAQHRTGSEPQPRILLLYFLPSGFSYIAWRRISKTTNASTHHYSNSYQQYQGFPRGLPSENYPGLMFITFSVQIGTSVGGRIAHWIAFSLCTHRPRVWFLAVPIIFRNSWCCRG